MAIEPPPLGLEAALRYSEQAIAHADRLGVAIGIAVVDEMGRAIQIDRMDESALISGEMAEAKAMTALKFRRPSSTLTDEFRGNSARMRAIEKLANFTILAMGGGLPILLEGRLVGAIGVSGSGAAPGRDEPGRVNDEQIAKLGLGAS
jgi:glc operon protein GlcG